MGTFELKTADGGTVFIEEAEPDAGSGFERTGVADQAMERATDSMEQLSSHLADTIAAVGVNLAKAKDKMAALRPDKMEVELGLKLSASGSVIVAKTAAEAHLKVKFVWEADSPA